MTTTVADAPAGMDSSIAGSGAGSNSAARIFERVRARVGESSGWRGVDLASLSQRHLLESSVALAQVKREVETMQAALAHEIARRSDADAGAGGLARRQGYQSPAKLIAAQTGDTTAEAQRLINVGNALALTVPDEDAAAGAGEVPGEVSGRLPGGEPGSDAGGELVPPAADQYAPQPTKPKFEFVSRALGAGRLSIEAANSITRMLERVEAVTTADVRVEAERDLVERAQRLSADQLMRLVRRTEAWLDREQVKLTYELLRDERYLIMREDAAGMVVINGKLDPETAAPVRAALDAMVAHGLRQRRDQDRLSKDVRSAAQMRADALAAFARHVLGCTSEKLPLGSTTVVMRINVDDLRDDDAVGEIDGIGQPVPAGVLRRMAADAGVIPMVLGGESDVLDYGLEERWFTWRQKLALVERDGGCAFCGAPPSFTEVHHILWWERDLGPTDLSNGVLLCVRCHHLIHRDGWEILATATRVEFVPPASIDPTRRRRLGGREMFDCPRQWRARSSSQLSAGSAVVADADAYADVSVAEA